MTAKSAADERMFPAFFSKVNGMGAPITGMIVMGVVQSVMALTTISPSLSEQFGVLVNLAVVTNVVPYIIALSALPLMMQTARRRPAKYRKNVAVAVVAMVYSVYAIYASGKDAVLGGAIVWGLGYVIWGFIAPRFAPTAAAAPRAGVVTAPVAILAFLLAAGRARVGREPSSRSRRQARSGSATAPTPRPLSFRDESGKPAGYSVALCQRIVDVGQGRAGARRPGASSGCP